MKTRLCPVPFEKMVRTIRTFGIVFFLFGSILFSIMFFFGLLWDVGARVAFILMFSILILPGVIVGILYERISGSTVVVMADKLLVVDSHGNCWREISFDSINAIKIEEIATLSSRYAYSTEYTLICFKYICVYINDQKDSSDIPYRSLLRKKYNKFPIFFQEEFYAELLRKLDSYRNGG